MTLAILASSTILIIVSFLFEKYVVVALRRKISLSALLVGSLLVSVGGFKVSEAVGFFSSAAVLLLIAFLFGYDRG
jgi:hypothetical protein